MNIQVLSDLHLEFHTDFGREFIVSYLSPEKVDLLIVAGDLGVGKSLVVGLNFLAEVYKKVPIVYVPGNHEYYNSSFLGTRELFDELERRYKHLHILNNRAMNIDGQYFVGSTLWFSESPDIQRLLPQLSDTTHIANFSKEVFFENELAKNFLEWHVCPGAIVITHMMPSMRSVHKKYKDDPLNALFVCEVDDIIELQAPKLWVHGHTHTSTNYMHGKTHVVCNPLGYVGHEVNPEFIPKMIIDV